MKSRRTRPRSGAGYSIMEMMASLLVVSIGMLGLTSMSFRSARSVQDAAEIALATNIATATIDELQAGDYDALVDGAVDGFPIFFNKYGGTDVSSADDYFEYFQVDAVIDSVSVDERFKDITVTVTWKDERTTYASEGNVREVIVRGRLRQLGVGGP